MQSKLEALIAKLEAATGPDRALDCAIAEEMGYAEVELLSDGSACYTNAILPGPPEGRGEYHDIRDVPTFTDSIDAALTLVPEGMGVAIDLSTKMADGKAMWRCVVGPSMAVWHPSLAIALTSAALRARSATP